MAHAVSRTATAAAFVTAVALLAGCTNSATGGSPTGAVPPPSTSATAIPTTSGTGSAAASPKPADVVVRFAIGSDAHWGMQGTDYRAYLRSFVDEVNSLDTAPGLDLAVVNGDLTNEGTKFLPQARTELERLSVPYVVTRGNNDYASDKQWRTIWGREINSTETIAGRLFVFASTSDGKGSQDCPDGKWIEKTLAAHADATDVYLVFHVPPVNRSTLELRCSRLQRLLAEQPRIRAVFNGHVHDLDSVLPLGDVPYLFDGHIGASTGVPYHGFRVVELLADGGIHTWTTDGTRRIGDVTLPPRT